MNDSNSKPAPALPSATVVVAREAASAPQVLMVQRHARATFGAVHAFPGGVLCAADRSARRFCDGLSAAEANRRPPE